MWQNSAVCMGVGNISRKLGATLDHSSGHTSLNIPYRRVAASLGALVEMLLSATYLIKKQGKSKMKKKNWGYGMLITVIVASIWWSYSAQEARNQALITAIEKCNK